MPTPSEWHLIHTYEDIGWSGEDLDRPGLLALLSDLDFEILIVDRTDRLTCKKKDLDFFLTSPRDARHHLRAGHLVVGAPGPVHEVVVSPESQPGVRST